MYRPMDPYERFLAENSDVGDAMLSQEREIFELVHILVQETCRLHDLVLDARCKANALAIGRAEAPYPMLFENAYNACLDDHPAMLRYFELYGEPPF